MATSNMQGIVTLCSHVVCHGHLQCYTVDYDLEFSQGDDGVADFGELNLDATEDTSGGKDDSSVHIM